MLTWCKVFIQSWLKGNYPTTECCWDAIQGGSHQHTKCTKHKEHVRLELLHKICRSIAKSCLAIPYQTIMIVQWATSQNSSELPGAYFQESSRCLASILQQHRRQQAANDLRTTTLLGWKHVSHQSSQMNMLKQASTQLRSNRKGIPEALQDIVCIFKHCCHHQATNCLIGKMQPTIRSGGLEKRTCSAEVSLQRQMVSKTQASGL